MHEIMGRRTRNGILIIKQKSLPTWPLLGHLRLRRLMDEWEYVHVYR